LQLQGRGISKAPGSEVAVYIASGRCYQFQERRAKWRLTNLRPGISPAVDPRAFISNERALRRTV